MTTRTAAIPGPRIPNLDRQIACRRAIADTLIRWIAPGDLARALPAVLDAIAPHLAPEPPPAPTFKPTPPVLAPRLLDVLRGMAAGRRNTEIGLDLGGLSEDTVKTHAQRLYRALGAHDRAHAVALGYQLGILP